jgi:hypothetical protein
MFDVIHNIANIGDEASPTKHHYFLIPIGEY